MKRLLTALLAVLAMSATAQAKRTVVVAADGSGDYRDVQTAVDSAPASGLAIRIKPGVYYQVISIPRNNIELRGLGAQPQDVVLTFGNSHAMAGGTSKSASTTVSGDNFLAENLTFENSFERDQPDATGENQAVALLSLGDRQVYRHVRLIGAQDTLYANSKTCHSAEETAAAKPCRAARQYFVDCYIEGHVDFIFGDAKAVFDHCELHARAHPQVMLTAQSRLYPAEDSGYLFLNCTVTADPAATNIIMGRPWRPYSTVVFLNTDFKAQLNPVGWSDWDGRLKTSAYAEYHPTGNASDLTKRLAGTRVLTPTEAARYTIKDWLAGADSWDPRTVK